MLHRNVSIRTTEVVERIHTYGSGGIVIPSLLVEKLTRKSSNKVELRVIVDRIHENAFLVAFP